MTRCGGAMLAVLLLVSCTRTPKEHSAVATRKLKAMIDSIATDVAGGFPVEAAPQPDEPQSCVGAFSNDKGTVRTSYQRRINIPAETSGSNFAEQVRDYLKGHGYDVDQVHSAHDPRVATVSAGRDGYDLLIDVDPLEGRAIVGGGTPCVKP